MAAYETVRGKWIDVPANLRFPGTASVAAAPFWEDRVSKFAEADQQYLDDVMDRYSGTARFQDTVEQRRLVEQGFPMPEEWLAVRDLPTAELERLVEQGNVKAKMFYVDRVSQEIGRIRANGDGLGTTPEDTSAQHGRRSVANYTQPVCRLPRRAHFISRFSQDTTGAVRGRFRDRQGAGTRARGGVPTAVLTTTPRDACQHSDDELLLAQASFKAVTSRTT